jgi:GNAT superfamily N-acetyltransferase
MQLKLRALRESDIRALMQLKSAANWNQTEADWRRLLRLEPQGCFGLEAGDAIVASATTVRYGKQLSWIGMVLTLPEVRGRGFARQLVEHAIHLSRNTEAVRLDASDMGKGLYLSLGFVDECPIERWVREPAPAAGPNLPVAAVDPVFDREIFGADRSALLADLAQHESAGVHRGYAFCRPGSSYYFFGPWVAENPENARALLAWFLSRHGNQATCIDLFPHHEDAVALAREYGYAPARRLTRMVLSPAARTLPDEHIYGAAGFEFG